MYKRNKRYLIEVQETSGVLGIGRPRIAGTRISLELFSQMGLTMFRKRYPEYYKKKKVYDWSQVIKELKV